MEALLYPVKWINVIRKIHTVVQEDTNGLTPLGIIRRMLGHPILYSYTGRCILLSVSTCMYMWYTHPWEWIAMSSNPTSFPSLLPIHGNGLLNSYIFSQPSEVAECLNEVARNRAAWCSGVR